MINKGVLERGGAHQSSDQILTLKQIGEKAREKNHRVYVGFIDLEKASNRVNREAQL